VKGNLKSAALLKMSRSARDGQTSYLYVGDTSPARANCKNFGPVLILGTMFDASFEVKFTWHILRGWSGVKQFQKRWGLGLTSLRLSAQLKDLKQKIHVSDPVALGYRKGVMWTWRPSSGLANSQWVDQKNIGILIQ
jgi:hypothetical protein